MSMTLIETKTLGTAAASIEFTSIPQTFTDLVLTSSARGDNSSSTVGIEMRFNGATTNRSNRGLLGNGSSANSFSSSIQLAGVHNNSTSTANTFGNSVCYIPNYSGSTAKSSSVDCSNENNDVLAISILVANLWNNTAAITSIYLQPEVGGNFVAGSTFSLYGILKGSDGIVTTS